MFLRVCVLNANFLDIFVTWHFCYKHFPLKAENIPFRPVSVIIVAISHIFLVIPGDKNGFSSYCDVLKQINNFIPFAPF